MTVWENEVVGTSAAAGISAAAGTSEVAGTRGTPPKKSEVAGTRGPKTLKSVSAAVGTSEPMPTPKIIRRPFCDAYF